MRYFAAKAILKIGEKALPALDALINALKDENANVRYFAAKAIWKIGEKAFPAVDALINALKDEDENVRYFAAKTIGKIGKKALPALMSALKNENTEIRESTAIILGNMGWRALSAISKLENTLKDENIYVRVAAAEALFKIDEESAEGLVNIDEILKKKVIGNINTTGVDVVWQNFRKSFPYHIQTLAIQELGKECCLIISEPPPHVRIESIKKLLPQNFPETAIQVKKHSIIGIDGWVKDIVIRLPKSDFLITALIEDIYELCFFTRYKAHALQLPLPNDNNEYNLDIKVTPFNIKQWLLDNNEVFFSITEEQEISFNNIMKNKQTGVFFNKTGGLVIWVIPRYKNLPKYKGEAGQVAVDLAEYKVEARQFAVETDMIIGATANKEIVAILGRERIIPINMLPPLRTEMIMTLASAKGDLAQSYNWGLSPTGKYSRSTYPYRVDLVPVYLSDSLLDTEYGSILCIADSLLKTWSENGEVINDNFDYPKPKKWPFPMPLFDYFKELFRVNSLVYNWNTTGNMYSMQDEKLQYTTPIRTGGLPISYIPGIEFRDLSIPIRKEETIKAEEIAYDYFASLNDNNLVRVAQYSTLFQIFRDYDIQAKISWSKEKRQEIKYKKYLTHRDRKVFTKFENIYKYFPSNSASWMRTPSFVLSWYKKDIFRALGGHNVDAKVHSILQNRGIKRGTIKLEENVVKCHPKDIPRLQQMMLDNPNALKVKLKEISNELKQIEMNLPRVQLTKKTITQQLYPNTSLTPVVKQHRGFNPASIWTKRRWYSEAERRFFMKNVKDIPENTLIFDMGESGRCIFRAKRTGVLERENLASKIEDGWNSLLKGKETESGRKAAAELMKAIRGKNEVVYMNDRGVNLQAFLDYYHPNNKTIFYKDDIDSLPKSIKNSQIKPSFDFNDALIILDDPIKDYDESIKKTVELAKENGAIVKANVSVDQVAKFFSKDRGHIILFANIQKNFVRIDEQDLELGKIAQGVSKKSVMFINPGGSNIASIAIELDIASRIIFFNDASTKDINREFYKFLKAAEKQGKTTIDKIQKKYHNEVMDDVLRIKEQGTLDKTTRQQRAKQMKAFPFLKVDIGSEHRFKNVA